MLGNPPSIGPEFGISYCRIVLHDTMLKSDSYRTGTSDTALCECGKGEETIEHFLLHCGIYAEARSDMMDCLKDIGCVSRSKANFTASKSLLLAPPNDNSNSRKHNNIIKEALFQYISDTKRML